MKSFFAIGCIIVFLFLTSCKKSDDSTTPIAPTNEMFNPANATLLKQGTFSGNAQYNVSGSVKLYDFQGNKYIHFENFSSSNGPDLKVYLATSNNASQFVNLGVLKSVSGTQTYLINNPPDFNQFNKVLIWCQRFSALFGASTIQ